MPLRNRSAFEFSLMLLVIALLDLRGLVEGAINVALTIRFGIISLPATINIKTYNLNWFSEALPVVCFSGDHSLIFYSMQVKVKHIVTIFFFKQNTVIY